MAKELKLYKHIKDDIYCYYLLGFLHGSYIIGILLNDSIYSKKGDFSTGWTRFEECNNITGNISITSNVADVYLDKNNNPVMKCSRYERSDIYILINEMEEYIGSLEDLTKVDKVIIKVH